MNIAFSSLSVFFVSLLITLCIAYWGRDKKGDKTMINRSMNRWFVGLSAGATSNSAFVVVGAVGLGYQFGATWLMLPLAWFLGDLFYWKYFPAKLNQYGRKHEAVTLSELLVTGLPQYWVRKVTLLVAIIVLVGLLAYISAQWIAGQKFISSAFGFSPELSMMFFATFIILYSTIGGFRGSIYVDTFQAILRVCATLVVIATTLYWVLADIPTFIKNIQQVDEGFFIPFYQMPLTSVIAFIIGWAAAALGFGLGHPQLVSRYLSGSSPEETKAAKWIYITFVQFTWITMTLFGLFLKGLMPNLSDPETGLNAFVQVYMHAIVAGIILADVFAIIASTANSLLISLYHTVVQDLLSSFKKLSNFSPTVMIIVLGLLSFLMSLTLSGSVASIIMRVVSLVSSCLAVQVGIKLFKIPHNGASLFTSILVGLGTSLTWILFGFSEILNEAVVGMFASWLTNYTVFKCYRTTTSDYLTENNKL